MRHEAKITSKGQITLPAALRKLLNLKPGDRVAFNQEPDGRVVLEARTGTLADLRGIVRLKKPVSSKDIERWIREARGARALRALGKSKPRARS
jgi:AbrB family looped-hinge helix DNA binding protein